MQNYKSSFYNCIIPIPEKNVSLIYNLLYGGLCELGQKEMALYKKLETLEDISIQDCTETESGIIEKLAASKYLVEKDLDEREIYLKSYNMYRGKKYNIESDDTSEVLLTIAPTLNCNFECPYCFQEHYADRKMTDETFEEIISFLNKNVFEKKKIKNFGVTWYGGEPLLELDMIKRYSEKMIKLSEGKGIKYNAKMITNGTLLKENVWDTLIDCRISSIQVTIDGNRTTHNGRRKLTGEFPESYDIIMENLRRLPEEIFLLLRINTDKVILRTIEELLGDLEKNNIWPQKAKQIKIYSAPIYYHENGNYDSIELFNKVKEYYSFEEQLRELKIKRYNKWAELNGQNKAKRKFMLPTLDFNECGTAVHPYGFAVDPEGYIHKCWEYVDKKESRVQHVTEEYDESNPKMKMWLDFDKTKQRKNCGKCKYEPICDSGCTKQVMYDKRNHICTSWKYLLDEIIKKQYLLSIENPDAIECKLNI